MADEGNNFPGSVLLSEKVIEAVDFALRVVGKYDEPLLPFVWTDIEHQQFLGETLEESLAMARNALPKVKYEKYRLVGYDGYLTAAGNRTDAIYVDAQDAGASQAIRIAQRYRKDNGKREAELIGDLLILGKIDSFDIAK